WNKSVEAMEDLGDGWYRYTRTIIVSTEKNNIGSDRVVFQLGYAENAVSAGDWENDYYLLKNISFKKTREITESRPKVTGATTATFDYTNKADVTFTVDLNGNDIELVKNETTQKSLGKAGTNYNYDGETKTLTISKDYLATLDNGEYVLSMKTLGGNIDFTVTVTNKGADQPETSDAVSGKEDANSSSKKSCGGVIEGSLFGLIGLVACAFGLGKKRR
ncbi:MAG: hypothetical protein IJU84_06360, partial [Clostridia bacterium]|nr:hypothetical protein [Clostridia bacterium]